MDKKDLGQRLFLAWTGCYLLAQSLLSHYARGGLLVIFKYFLHFSWFLEFTCGGQPCCCLMEVLCACSIINRFPHVAGELFGLLIAMLFMQ
ncbi:hypothetical protein MANES_06G005700v8 [Manihot esculenta]|uniref:Uncharacterized protein n=1 Tax=Manihot esculenta TaxID=3983 RepID=A0A2C9VP26_MANES|nr:hypothetical protein MANES_06G005700v8 [Manihot esculenta]